MGSGASLKRAHCCTSFFAVVAGNDDIIQAVGGVDRYSRQRRPSPLFSSLSCEVAFVLSRSRSNGFFPFLPLSFFTRRMNFPSKLNEMITAAAAETSSVLTPSENLDSRLEVKEEEHFFLGHVDLNQLDTVRPNCRQHAPSAAFAAGGPFARIDSGRFGTSEFNTMMMMIGELDGGRVE